MNPFSSFISTDKKQYSKDSAKSASGLQVRLLREHALKIFRKAFFLLNSSLRHCLDSRRSFVNTTERGLNFAFQAVS
jgi:hypothetical protein